MLQDQIRVLHNASAEGDLKTVRSLTGSNMKLAMSKDEDGNLPIHRAASMGHADIVSYLAQIYPGSVNSLNSVSLRKKSFHFKTVKGPRAFSYLCT
jgi:ankyrin repeat protein